MIDTGTIIWRRDKSQLYIGVHKGSFRFSIRPCLTRDTVMLYDTLKSVTSKEFPDSKSAMLEAENRTKEQGE
jgi:hypothetical protein